MNVFHTIAIPHKDILEGRLTMDVFAADLWEVSQNRGPDEYRDSDTFFRKTYLTEGLKNLIAIVEKRLQGKGGDPVIQIQTPFGGGKTHALIAMYHKASEWKAKKAVIVGTALGTEVTLWGFLEKQLTGKTERFSGQVSPGREAIRELLYKNQPVLILMDEVLEYATKAAGVKVGQSTLAAQTIAFIQELTEAISNMERACVVVTLPSSITEHYDESAEKLYPKNKKVSGRIEKIYTPVQEYEITKIIRRRLFSNLNERQAKEIVGMFMSYAEKEGILPSGVEPSEYGEQFIYSYPFMPEVVNVLYQRWGSFPNFQRTRGVLRLLSLVIYSLKESSQNYISLADFDLANQEIRQELLKHIGTEFNGIIAADITDRDSGSKKVDVSLGNAYHGLKLGTRATRTIFLYSFSGGQVHGATISEIKRSATTLGNPSSVVAEAIEQLKLNRILLTKMENVRDEELVSLEREILKQGIKGDKLRVFIWEENPVNIPDSEEIRLIILRSENKETLESIIKTKGQTPRVYRNTLIFLYPLESERGAFINTMRRKIAYEYIQQDDNLRLSDEQKKEVKKELKSIESDLKESIRRLYRIVGIPAKDGLKNIDLGIPTYGEEKWLDQEVYTRLRSDGEILEKVFPLVIKEKYLSNREYVLTEQMYQSSLKTPGETRIVDKSAIEQGIAEGVRVGLFGLGEMKDNIPICLYFKEQPSIALSGNEVLINEALCREQKEKVSTPEHRYPEPVIQKGGEKVGQPEPIYQPKSKKEIQLRFRVPKGKVSSIMGIMNLLQSKFETLEIELKAMDGAISEQDYDDKIKETFRQLGIELRRE